MADGVLHHPVEQLIGVLVERGSPLPILELTLTLAPGTEDLPGRHPLLQPGQFPFLPADLGLAPPCWANEAHPDDGGAESARRLRPCVGPALNQLRRLHGFYSRPSRDCLGRLSIEEIERFGWRRRTGR